MPSLKLIDHPGPGRFLVFCGVDGTGKSTVVDLVRQGLEERGQVPQMIKQPSPFIREYRPFRDHVEGRNREDYAYSAISMIVQADRVQMSAQVIGPAMAEGKVVISDRYVLSGLARLILAGETETEWFYATSRLMIKPTRTFLLHADPKIIRKRLDARDFEVTDDQQFQEIVTQQEIMLKLAEEMDVLTIDTSGIQAEEAVARVFANLPDMSPASAPADHSWNSQAAAVP